MSVCILTVLFVHLLKHKCRKTQIQRIHSFIVMNIHDMLAFSFEYSNTIQCIYSQSFADTQEHVLSRLQRRNGGHSTPALLVHSESAELTAVCTAGKAGAGTDRSENQSSNTKKRLVMLSLQTPGCSQT